LKRRPKSFYLGTSMALLAAAFPLFYRAGVSRDAVAAAAAFALALAAAALTLVFC